MGSPEKKKVMCINNLDLATNCCVITTFSGDIEEGLGLQCLHSHHFKKKHGAVTSGTIGEYVLKTNKLEC